MTAVAPRPWARLPRELAGALSERLEPTVEDVARTVSESVPAFAAIDEPKFERDVHHAVQVAVERFLELVGTDEPALPAAAREVFVALGAAEARDERGPEVLLAALRTASRVLLRVASGALDSIGPGVDGDLLDLVDAVTAYVDELVAATTDGYALQLQEQAGETDRRRRLLGDLLLRGGVAEPVVLAAAADIGWPSLAEVTPVLLPLVQARDARFRYGAEGVVVDRERDAVLLVRTGRRARREQLAEALRGRGAVVGPTVPWARVPEAVRLAQQAAQLTGRLSGDHPDRDPVVFTVDHLADLALGGDAGAMAALADRRLEPFAVMQPAARDRLLRTLRSWLLHWGSRADVAAELFIHPQTVSYRIRRLRALLGDDLSDPVARFELLLVLAGRGAPGR
ncbi:MAG TPA: helix-turn-helix domain-containing protein [Marmoricola sp.]|nr:helix-turn-helix domain-containing protein [Marmoricola sp.]